MAFEIRPEDVPVILDWYEYAVIDSYHRGGATLILPDEQLLLDQLRRGSGIAVTPCESGIEMIFDWMHKAIQRKYGSSKYLTSGERALFDRLVAAVEVIAEKRPDQRACPSELPGAADAPARGPDWAKRLREIAATSWEWLLVAAVIGLLVVWGLVSSWGSRG